MIIPRIIIHNLRLGLATNSSSSHSLIFLSNRRRVKDKGVKGLEFGWDFFTAASENAKLNYIAVMLNQALSSELNEEDHKRIVTEWVGRYPSSPDEYWKHGYIDHNSAIQIPYEYGKTLPDRQFFDELKAMILMDGVVIGGGNDNEDHLHPLIENGNKAVRLDRIPLTYGGQIARKDELQDFWTIFNSSNGSKLRFSFAKPSSLVPQEFDPEHFLSDPLVVTRSATPELVDITITHFCAENCFVAGTEILTPNGSKNIEDIVVGDEILNYNFQSESNIVNVVTDISKREYEGDLIVIELDNNITLKVTPEHPLFTKNRGWVKAKDLTDSDDLAEI